MKTDYIYDESGLIVGEVSATENPDVREHTDTVSRNDFVLEYLTARERKNVSYRTCW